MNVVSDAGNKRSTTPGPKVKHMRVNHILHLLYTWKSLGFLRAKPIRANTSPVCTEREGRRTCVLPG